MNKNDRNPHFLDVFPVKEGDTNQEQSIVSGAWSDFTDGRTPDSIEDLPAGTTMVAVIQDPDGPTVRYVRLGGGGIAIPCALTQDGGIDGTATTAPTYTYTCKDAAGATIKDGNGDGLATVAPKHNRPNGMTMPGTYGTLWPQPDGTYLLYQTDEAPNRAKLSC